jgi:hypothetical protein
MKKRKPYFIGALLEDGTELEIGRDGLLYKITIEQAETMLKQYPKKGDDWFFNDSFDRTCAELDYNCVIVNPSIIAKISPLLACNN